MPSNSSDNKNTASGSKTAGAAPSKASIVKEGWGSRSNFQASYGLDMTPEGLEQGEAILDQMRAGDAQGAKGAGK